MNLKKYSNKYKAIIFIYSLNRLENRSINEIIIILPFAGQISWPPVARRPKDQFL